MKSKQSTKECAKMKLEFVIKSYEAMNLFIRGL